MFFKRLKEYFKLKVLAIKAIKNNKDLPNQMAWLLEMRRGNYDRAISLLPDHIKQQKLEAWLSPSLRRAANALRDKYSMDRTCHPWRKN
jgi:hypothetical protein